jgi:Tol biopolymer transport system component/tRNA A-37 threonylcarbamoyl transferase component Bud32
MGEVYRARDLRLGRDVAIKVLPASVADNTERLRRFELEARAAGALSHPNILVVHDVGRHDDVPYVVCELLEGGTLREQLARGPFPVSRAISYGIEIARGLAAAHARGIVHRDIKPENLFLTRDGRIKILDFGIARMVHPTAVGDTSTMAATDAGVMIGTVGYMSPEQARGEPVDSRSDIFSLGMVLFELLAGRAPFTRDTRIGTLNALLTEDAPELPPLNPSVTPALDRVVRHCLEKDPAQRFQSARDVVFALEGLSSTSSTARAVASASPGWRNSRVSWLVGAAAAVAIAIAASLAAGMRNRVPAAAELRFEVAPPANGAFQGILGISSVLSPDGQSLLMAVTTPTGPRLFLRSLASTKVRMVEGTEGAANPFWSPDGRHIAFFAGGALKRIPVAGGAPQTICEARSDPWVVGAWGADDVILLTGLPPVAGSPFGAVYRVAASGGSRTVALAPRGGEMLAWPSFLPDGRHFLVTAIRLNQPGEVRVGSVGSTESTSVLAARSRAVYAPPGYLLFVREGSLVAQPFNRETFTADGVPVSIAEDMPYLRDLGQADFSAALTGAIAYQAGDTASQLTWYRRDGTEIGSIGEPGDFYFPRLSPDGTRVAADIMQAGTTDLWMIDLKAGGARSAVMRDQSTDWTPVFSPDGQQLAFAAARAGAPHLHLKRLADSSQGQQLLAPSGAVQFVTDWATGPDGPFLVFHDVTPKTGIDVMALSLGGTHAVRALARTPADDTDGRVSPDGQWLAYVSNESGRNEVYVKAISATDDRWMVSTGGGVSPRWRGDGRELFYLATSSAQEFGSTVPDGRLIAISVSTDRGFRAEASTPLFTVRVLRGNHYDVTADGQRFLVNVGSGAAALPITVALNWAQGLER